MELIQKLPDGPLDIIGDIHGEYDALLDLLSHLGYDVDGNHPEHRTVIFVGDFVDRGHNSTAVLALAERWINAGHARAILGNHEINLLRNDAKHGSGWFFEVQHESDSAEFGFYHRPDSPTREKIISFLSSLPIGLERQDLRVIHAVWDETLIAKVRDLNPISVKNAFDQWEFEIETSLERNGLSSRKKQEKAEYADALNHNSVPPTLLRAHAEYDEFKQMGNPLKVLTSGVERQLDTDAKVFRAGGKWRFVERVSWWDTYEETTPIVVGHYWRTTAHDNSDSASESETSLFQGTHPFSWHGKRKNVFCVDFSVGARWSERKQGISANHKTKLAALRWPERSLMFDDGLSVETTDFCIE